MYADLSTNYATPHLNIYDTNLLDIRVLWAESNLLQEGERYTNTQFQKIAEQINKLKDEFPYCKICFEYRGVTFTTEIYKNQLPSVERLIDSCERIITNNKLLIN